MEGMFRRGGIWWARLAVPARLRPQAGRREFIQSTRTHDHAVGKLIATVLLAEWRRKLLEWEGQSLDNDKLLRLVEGNPAFSIAQHITVREASEATGLNQDDLMRAASSGKLGLFTSLGPTVHGHVLPMTELELDDPALGAEGGVIVPRAPYMPALAQEARFFCQTLRITDSQAFAKAILADGLDRIEIMLLEAQKPAGWVFVPSETLHVAVDAIALDALEVEALRLSLVARISSERVAHAVSERKARMQNELQRAQSAALVPAQSSASPVSGKWASKRFSEAVEGYCESPDGLPGTLASPIDQRQRKAELLANAPA
jgi:hypothetical protein